MSLLFLDLGTGEVLLIILAIFLVFGPGKIPEMARGLGKFVGEIKRASEDVKNEINREADRIERETKLKEYKKKLDLEGNGEEKSEGEEAAPAKKKKTTKAKSTAKKTPSDADIVSEEQVAQPAAKKAASKKEPAASAKSKATTSSKAKTTARKPRTTAKKTSAATKEAKPAENAVKKSPAKKPAAKKAKPAVKKTSETTAKEEVKAIKPVPETETNQT